MKKLLLLFLGCGFLFTAQAYRIEWGRTVTITQPVHEDLYVAGGTVTINAPVYGDLIVAGGTIFLNDTVANDLLLAGGTVHFNGYVADDLRCAGGELHILQNVGGDLVITGGRVDVARSVIINGGLVTGGGDVTFDGTANGNIRSAAGIMRFNGTGLGNFEFHGGTLVLNGEVKGQSVIAARQLQFGSHAVLGNNVRYWTERGQVDFGKSLRNGTAVYDPSLKIRTNSWYFLGRSTVLGLIWYLSTVFIFILLLQYLFRSTFRRAGDTVDESMLKSLGSGLLFFVCVPVLIGVLLITVVGIPVGLILMAGYILLLLLATVITSLVFANWYNHRFAQQWTFWQIVAASMAMFVLFKLVTFTPFFGWLVMIIVASIAFGALLKTIDWRRRHPVAVS